MKKNLLSMLVLAGLTTISATARTLPDAVKKAGRVGGVCYR